MWEREDPQVAESTSLILWRREGRQKGKVASASTQCQRQDWNPERLDPSG